ncbi:hypothetical protein L1766_01775 [Thermovorax subterraneus]|nr:hypothetical protein [Thermovorax subterraneus]
MKIRKYLLILILLALLTLSTGQVWANTNNAQEIKFTIQNVIIDGKETKLEAYLIGNNYYFKLRDIAKLLDETASEFSITYDAKTRAVFIMPGEEYKPIGSELTIGKNKAALCILSKNLFKVKDLTIKAPKYLIGGYHYLTLRDMGNALGFSVTYDESKKVPIITTGKFSLVFDVDKYEKKTATLDNKIINYRAYENIIYVTNPVDPEYQYINIYIPEEYFVGKSIGNYNANTAPIFFPNRVGGYMPAKADSPGFKQDGSPNASLVALSKGYIVASPAARGRTLKGVDSSFTGKAPACIVDLKAAVRYLRYNDEIMPGDAEKIIPNGTSAGGALTSLLGATGNHPDYEPYLEEINAAKERDDVFAVSSYCPITNLDNADMAYEWQFYGINDYNFAGRQGTLSEEQIALSAKLKSMFTDYVNSLNLKKPDGTLLILDEKGNGTFKDFVKSFLIQSAQKALSTGKDLSTLDFITIENGTVKDIDFEAYNRYITRMKPVPAFDALDASSWENSLFGDKTIDNKHFTKFSKMHSLTGAPLADEKIVKMMNPMNYIGSKEATIAKYWRIRHGAKDRDTSFAIPVILATKLQNEGYKVDFAMPWGVPHSGDYDLDELFNWMDNVIKEK